MTSDETNATTMRLLDQAFDQYFERSIREAAAISMSYQELWQSLYDFFRAGGKRLRPQLTLFAYEAFGGSDTPSIIPIAAAQEMLHFSLLIHDDIIDRDYSRHATANIAGRYRERYAPYLSSSDDQTHFAQSTAIVAGDLMLSSAHELIATSSIDAARRSEAQRLLSGGVFEAAGGELLDIELSFMPYSPGEALLTARYKTAGYSFLTPLTTGAALAEASQVQRTHLRDFAVALGIAYQLTDDLLGVFGDEHVTGKSTTSDIIEGKMTFIVEQALELMQPHQKRQFMSIFGNQQASLDDIEIVRSLFRSTGAKQRTNDKISEYIHAARQSLHLLQLSKKQIKTFENLITKIVVT